MFVNVKKDGKTIACYRKDMIIGVSHESNGECTIMMVDCIKIIITITEQDFSDLVSQLKQA